MPRALPFGKPDQSPVGYMIFCPACQCGHLFNTVPGPNGVGGQKPTWSFDGNLDRPTFSPSLRCRTGTDGKDVCHSFVRAGRIEFCLDSTHALAGQTVDLPDWDDLDRSEHPS